MVCCAEVCVLVQSLTPLAEPLLEASITQAKPGTISSLLPTFCSQLCLMNCLCCCVRTHCYTPTLSCLQCFVPFRNEMNCYCLSLSRRLLHHQRVAPAAPASVARGGREGPGSTTSPTGASASTASCGTTAATSFIPCVQGGPSFWRGTCGRGGARLLPALLG